ncbi:MAG TPA: hypothetical protein VGV90_11295 [Solirubrobacteraceae bacterium]|nr:hypothetical protein [Solirubrobacteraceae bacterium]
MQTLYDWAGGQPAFERLIDAFYDRVEADELLAFRSALVAYLEWGTRLALHNSQPGAAVAPHAPVPRWGWGEAPPYVP